MLVGFFYPPYSFIIKMSVQFQAVLEGSVVREVTSIHDSSEED